MRLRYWIALLIALQLVDDVETTLFLRLGVPEGNPTGAAALRAGQLPALFLVKLLAVLLVVAGVLWIRAHAPTWLARLAMLAPVAVWSAVVVWNLHVWFPLPDHLSVR